MKAVHCFPMFSRKEIMTVGRSDGECGSRNRKTNCNFAFLKMVIMTYFLKMYLFFIYIYMSSFTPTNKNKYIFKSKSKIYNIKLFHAFTLMHLAGFYPDLRNIQKNKILPNCHFPLIFWCEIRIFFKNILKIVFKTTLKIDYK